ncbi:hypothetical protein PENTCL1PPCAC_29830, partial [Pristionchus entomophagus]
NSCNSIAVNPLAMINNRLRFPELCGSRLARVICALLLVSILCVIWIYAKNGKVPVPPGCSWNGVWSEWVTTGHCPSTCGSCHVATRKRTCTNLCGDCPCAGPSEDVGPCGTSLCFSPALPTGTCCKPYKQSINYPTGNFFCGRENYAVNECTRKLLESKLEVKIDPESIKR